MTSTITPELLDKARIDAAELAGIELGAGSHDRRAGGLCIMEAVAWLAGRPHSDAPPCVAPSLRRFLMALNDRAPTKHRQRLKEVAMDVIGTATRGSERVRAFALADWAARVCAAAAAESAGRPEIASSLRSLPEITDDATAKVAREACIAARVKLRASADASYAAGYASASAYAASASAYATYAYAYADAAADASAAAYAAYAAAAADASAAAYAAAEDVAWANFMDQAIILVRKLCAKEAP